MATTSSGETVLVDGRRLKLTNLDKVLYPVTGTTKAEVVAYYAEIAPLMLPYCAGRPATRKRWPDGVGTAEAPGEVFFIKNLESSAPEWVVRADIEHSAGAKTYPLVNDPATLAWLAQVAALEVHVPQWRFGSDGRPRNPDRMVLDLDPGPGVGLPECALVAGWAREILRGMALEPMPVTSGSKGIHLYAALDGRHSSEEISALAHELARALEADHKDLVVSDMKKTLRDGRVLVDWSQNNANKTTVAPYSLRGRPRPTVAAPRTWAELADPGLRHLEYREVLQRVRAGAASELYDPLAVLLASAGPGDGFHTPVQDRLATYRSMRDPTRTPEPVPPVVPPGAGQSFVIQEHHARRWHLDFRLAHDGVLVSWALPKGVPTDRRTNHLAVQTEDHPLEYATFEGTIPAGEYGGGEVRIWDAGHYELVKWHEGKEVIVVLTGRPGGGLESAGPGRSARLALIHTGGRGGQEPDNWLIHLMDGAGGARLRRDRARPRAAGRAIGGAEASAVHPPAPARPAGGAPADGGVDRGGAGRDRPGAGGASVRPARGHRDRRVAAPAHPSRGAQEQRESADVAAGAAGPGPATLAPMLATPGQVKDLHAGADWALEMKWDGVRALVVIDAGTVRLVSRNGNDVTALYPELGDVHTCLVGASRAVLDGEIVALDERGRPSFARLQQRFNLARPRDVARAREAAPVHLILFDVLEVQGQTVQRRSYDERRAVLHDLVDAAADPRVEVPEAFEGDVTAAVAASRAWGLEGVVAKRRDSRYAAGRRSRSWLKIKHTATQEVVVIGWRPGGGTREGGVGSLLLAVPGPGGALRYAGRVGTGFTLAEARTWAAELAAAEVPAPPAGDVPRLDARDARWARPERVAEVEYSEWTGDGRLRHPRWRGWRPDKAVDDVRVEGP